MPRRPLLAKANTFISSLERSTPLAIVKTRIVLVEERHIKTSVIILSLFARKEGEGKIQVGRWVDRGRDPKGRERKEGRWVGATRAAASSAPGKAARAGWRT